jgi:recombination protein RecR
MKQPDSISKLIGQFASLPGVGKKTAARYAYHVLSMTNEEVMQFSHSLLAVKEKIKLCKTCGGISENEICDICRTRDSSLICVVSYSRDIVSFERTGFDGVYHVLGGTISPIDGRGPEQLRIKELLSRLEGTREIIVATNPDVEGEATAVYLARLLKPMGIKVSRLAQGMSTGSDIEYVDEMTLTKAFDQRIDL